MRKAFILCLSLLTIPAFSQENLSENDPLHIPTESTIPTAVEAKPQHGGVLEVKWSAIDTLFKATSDTTYIVNFWATWCRPCVQELPHFEELSRNYASQKVRILLISMDFVKDMEDRVIPFVERMKLSNTVWLLNEPNANSWIERVDPTWSGALPATLIINTARSKRVFFEKALDYEALAREISYFMEY
jgi:thiol-disulfide isomerase/thioredoxin